MFHISCVSHFVFIISVVDSVFFALSDQNISENIKPSN